MSLTGLDRSGVEGDGAQRRSNKLLLAQAAAAARRAAEHPIRGSATATRENSHLQAHDQRQDQERHAQQEEGRGGLLEGGPAPRLHAPSPSVMS